MTSPWGLCDSVTKKRRRTVHCHTKDGANTPNSDCHREVPEKHPLLVQDCDPNKCPDVQLPPDPTNTGKCGFNLVVADFSGPKSHLNLLGYFQDVSPDGWNTYELSGDGKLILNAKTSSAYWYSIISDTCLDLSDKMQPELYITIIAPTNTQFTLELQQKNECFFNDTTASKTIGYPVTMN